MQRIRIGNDIRLNLTLRGPRTYDQANIKQLRCYLINTSVVDYFPSKHDLCGPHTVGNPYRIHGCGHPMYHVDHCHPHHYHDCRYCHHDHYCMIDGHACADPCNGQGPLTPRYHQPFDPVKCGIDDDFAYLAYSRVLPKANSIQCYFPAKDQMFCGIYKLVVVAVMYEPGWGRTDMHTYTMDYGDVLQLVDDNTGASGDITLDVDKNDMLNKNILSIKVKTHDLYMYGNTSLRLGELDSRDHMYTIEVELENGSVVEYNPDNWPYELLEFHAARTGVVAIDKNTGLIKALDQDDTVSTYITVSAKNNEVSAGFNVTVVGGDYDYIGYLPVRPFPKNMEDDYKYGFNRSDQSFENESQESYNAVGVENVNLALLTRTDDLTNPVTVDNDADGQYLWIVTRQPIAYAANINTKGLNNVDAATYIPLTKPQQKLNDTRYYYCCPNPIKRNKNTGGATIYVKLKNA